MVCNTSWSRFFAHSCKICREFSPTTHLAQVFYFCALARPLTFFFNQEGRDLVQLYLALQYSCVSFFIENITNQNLNLSTGGLQLWPQISYEPVSQPNQGFLIPDEAMLSCNPVSSRREKSGGVELLCKFLIGFSCIPVFTCESYLFCS